MSPLRAPTTPACLVGGGALLGALLLAAVAGAGCARDADSGGPAPGSSEVVAPLPTALPDENPCVSGSPGPRLLRRLGAAELTATVHDLLADAAAPVATIFNDQPALGFTVDARALLVRGLTGQQLMDNAENLAHWAVTNHLADLAQLAACSSMDAACRRRFIAEFGQRAFRRPLSDARIADYDQLFAAEASFSDGVEAVVTAMLQSPYFLYRTEIGDPGAAGGGGDVALSPYEVASSLSYFLWAACPTPRCWPRPAPAPCRRPPSSTSRCSAC